MIEQCKHGLVGLCGLCDLEDSEHDAAMAADAAESMNDEFNAWLVGNRRRMHCANYSDEDCMRAAWFAAVASAKGQA